MDMVEINVGKCRESWHNALSTWAVIIRYRLRGYEQYKFGTAEKIQRVQILAAKLDSKCLIPKRTNA